MAVDENLGYTQIHPRFEHLYAKCLHGLNIRIPLNIKPNTVVPVHSPFEVAWMDAYGAPAKMSTDIDYHSVNIDHTYHAIRHFNPLFTAINSSQTPSNNTGEEAK